MEADSLPGINYAEGNSLSFATLNSNPLFNFTFCTPPSIITSLHLKKNLFELGIISR